jgi:hypothetical protein
LYVPSGVHITNVSQVHIRVYAAGEHDHMDHSHDKYEYITLTVRRVMTLWSCRTRHAKVMCPASAEHQLVSPYIMSELWRIVDFGLWQS